MVYALGSCGLGKVAPPSVQVGLLGSNFSAAKTVSGTIAQGGIQGGSLFIKCGNDSTIHALNVTTSSGSGVNGNYSTTIPAGICPDDNQYLYAVNGTDSITTALQQQIQGLNLINYGSGNTVNATMLTTLSNLAPSSQTTSLQNALLALVDAGPSIDMDVTKNTSPAIAALVNAIAATVRSLGQTGSGAGLSLGQVLQLQQSYMSNIISGIASTGSALTTTGLAMASASGGGFANLLGVEAVNTLKAFIPTGGTAAVFTLTGSGGTSLNNAISNLALQTIRAIAGTGSTLSTTIGSGEALITAATGSSIAGYITTAIAASPSTGSGLTVANIPTDSGPVAKNVLFRTGTATQVFVSSGGSLFLATGISDWNIMAVASDADLEVVTWNTPVYKNLNTNGTWSTITAPTGLTFNTVSGTFSGTPSVNATYQISITAKDASNISSSTGLSQVNFYLTVGSGATSGGSGAVF